MKFFITDVALFLLSAAMVLLAIIDPGINNFALAIIAAGISIILVKKSQESFSDFERSVANIEGLAWKPLFLSTGTLELDYLGTRMYYSSLVKGEKKDAIPVEYRICTTSGRKTYLEVIGSEKPGEVEVKGDPKLFAKIKKPVIDFDTKYGLGYLRNRDGLLEFSVCLGFSKEPYPKDAKLADMTAFLHDYVFFVHAVHKAL